jgi:tRNA threonylcarbamoyladenosine biosynthesis protein TsaE
VHIHRNDLESIAARVAEKMQRGTPVLLFGPMGVGKSTLVRAIIRNIMPDAGHIPSPSFPIMIPYEAEIGPIWHVDLYRIASPQELQPLGLADVMRTDMCLIEWPERLGAMMPQQFQRVVMGFSTVPKEESPDLWRNIEVSSSVDAVGDVP